MSSPYAKKIVLQCEGGGSSSRLPIDVEVALQSKVIAELIIKPELLYTQEEIVVVLPDIKVSTMLKVITYCTLHAQQPPQKGLHFFDATFVDVDPDTLFHITHAAIYLNIKSLMDLTCRTLSKKIKGKTCEEIEEAVKEWKSLKKREGSGVGGIYAQNVGFSTEVFATTPTMRNLGDCTNAHQNLQISCLHVIQLLEKAFGNHSICRLLLICIRQPLMSLHASAFFVTQTLCPLSRDGRTVIAYIHRPSSEVLELFDRLYLLSGRKTVNFGQALEAYEFFAQTGFPCPEKPV